MGTGGSGEPRKKRTHHRGYPASRRTEGVGPGRSVAAVFGQKITGEIACGTEISNGVISVHDTTRGEYLPNRKETGGRKTDTLSSKVEEKRIASAKRKKRSISRRGRFTKPGSFLYQ